MKWATWQRVRGLTRAQMEAALTAAGLSPDPATWDARTCDLAGDLLAARADRERARKVGRADGAAAALQWQALGYGPDGMTAWADWLLATEGTAGARRRLGLPAGPGPDDDGGADLADALEAYSEGAEEGWKAADRCDLAADFAAVA